MVQVRLNAGDPRVDRRMEFAEIFEREGDIQAAIEVMRGVTEFVPDWVYGWHKLGCLAQEAGDRVGAVAAFERAVQLDPSDTLGAGVLLEVLGARAPSGQMPVAFVEALFDQYADRFDQSLVGKLGYRVPQRLGALVSEVGQGRFSQVLDLGCGTGLSGAVFRPISDHLSGVDISDAMLRKAHIRGVYDVLSKGDISQLPPLDPPVYDLVLAADVLIYLGDLSAVTHWVGAALHDGGLFAFSVEAAAQTAPYVIQPSRRYAHARSYVEEIFGAAGWSILTLSHDVLRQDRGADIWGYLCVVRRDRPVACAPVSLGEAVAVECEGPEVSLH